MFEADAGESSRKVFGGGPGASVLTNVRPQHVQHAMSSTSNSVGTRYEIDPHHIVVSFSRAADRIISRVVESTRTNKKTMDVVSLHAPSLPGTVGSSFCFFLLDKVFSGRFALNPRMDRASKCFDGCASVRRTFDARDDDPSNQEFLFALALGSELDLT